MGDTVIMKTITFFAGSMLLLTAPFNAAAVYDLAALMPAEGKFAGVLEEIRKQTGTNYRFHIIDMNKSVKVEDIARQCTSNNVQALILMDTKAIKAAVALEKFDSSFKALPKFALMTLMVESTSRGLSNIAGIKFEVPYYTVVMNFRIISQKEIKKVGIFFRKSFSGIIEESKKFLGREGIDICPVCVDCDPGRKTDPEQALAVMNRSVDKMVADEKIDVFLVPADNLIVNSKSLGTFWINKVKKMKLPIIAPIDMLASEKLGIAVFSADPDLPQLAAQAANQIIDHFENNTSMKDIGFEPTISIKSTLNLRVSREIGWKCKDEKLARVTRIIK
jgi:ABC-type uncharacterized transport system substrate-binding protein